MKNKIGFIIQLRHFNFTASQYFLFKTTSSSQKHFLLDCKESLNALLLDRTFKKPHCQSSCPVAGLVKGKFEF